MGGFSELDTALAVNLIVSLMSLHPLWRIFRRAGLPAWPSLLIFVPIAGWPLVGSFLAFQRWPNIPPRRPKKAR